MATTDVGEEEPETLEDIDPHWRATCWLQVAVQGIAEEEGALVRACHSTDIGGRGRPLVTGQTSPRCMVVEHQGVQGGWLPTCSDHPQYWSVYD